MVPKSILKALTAFIICSIVANAIKIQAIISNLPVELHEIIQITSYTSVIVQIFISSFIILLIAYVAYFFIDILDVEICHSEYWSSYRNMIYAFTLAEVIKIALVYVFLKREILSFSIDSFSEQMIQSQWYRYNNTLEISIFLIGTVIFLFSFKRQNFLSFNKIANIGILSFIIGFCLIIPKLL